MQRFLIQTYAFAYRNVLFAKRNVYFLVEMIFWPLVGLLSIGLMGDFLKLEERTLAFVLTGAIASGVLQVTQLDVGYSLLYDVWSKSVKHTHLAPVGLVPPLLGSWLIGIVRGTFIFILLVFLSKIFFQFSLPAALPTFSFLLGISWMSFLAGICVWNLILIFGQRAEVSVWAISYLLMLLCGIYYPVNFLPEPFFTFAQWIPLTYFLDEIRTHYGFTALFSWGLLKGWILNMAYTLLGFACAKWSLRYASNTGLVTRLSE